MSDIVERLRNVANRSYNGEPLMADSDLLNDAADAIEELLAERDGKKPGMWIGDDGKPLLADEIEDGCPNASCHCSVCGAWLGASDEYYVKGNYCPNCGAKMTPPKGEEE